LEEEDENEVYFAPLCIVEATMRGPQNEDDLIENLIQNPPPQCVALGELVEETQTNPVVDPYVVDLTNL